MGMRDVWGLQPLWPSSKQGGWFSVPCMCSTSPGARSLLWVPGAVSFLPVYHQSLLLSRVSTFPLQFQVLLCQRVWWKSWLVVADLKLLCDGVRRRSWLRPLATSCDATEFAVTVVTISGVVWSSPRRQIVAQPFQLLFAMFVFSISSSRLSFVLPRLH